MEIIILLFATTALFSIIGYGTFFNNIFLDKKNALNLGLIGFLGLFFLSSISYFTHFFRHPRHIEASIHYTECPRARRTILKYCQGRGRLRAECPPESSRSFVVDDFPRASLHTAGGATERMDPP